MSKPEITVAVGAYDRTQALITGEVNVEGTETHVLPFTEPGEMFHRMLQFGEFDASEMSMGSALLAHEKGLPFVAIPVFPRRVFRHSSVYVRSNSGISSPKDLEGKRVGISIYQNTAAVWVKGILQHDYGVNLEKVNWVAEEPESYRIDTELPSSIKLETIPPGTTLEEAITKGLVDAAISPRHLKAVVGGSETIVRLFRDYQAVEEEYYKKTGIFPIHHTVVVKRQVLERYPWLAVNLVKAFREAKARCFELRYWPGRYSVAWVNAWLDRERKIMGNDPWPYDLGKVNRLNLETLIQYSREQGVLNTKPDIDKVFAQSTLDV